MNVLILCTSYHPEPNGISIYSTDLATHLDAMGHNVKVITTRSMKDPIDCDGHRVSEIQTVRLNIRNTSSGNVALAIFNEFRLTLSFWKASRKEEIRPDTVIISIIPSLSSGIIARQLSKRWSIPHMTIFQDFTSLGSRQVGSRLGKAMGPLLQFIELFILNHAHKIVVVSEEMVAAVSNLNPKLSIKVHLIYNYFIKKYDTNDVHEFRQRHAIDKSNFVIMYTGNIGRKQGIENVLRTAEILHSELNIKFVIIGGGNQKNKIIKLSSGLTNVMMLPFQNEKHYAQILRSANVLLINELPTQLGMSLPSKSTAYLESGVPIIAAVPLQGPTSRFLKEKALVVNAGSPEELADAILKVFNGVLDLKENALRGKKFAEESLNARKSRKEYSRIVESLFINNVQD